MKKSATILILFFIFMSLVKGDFAGDFHTKLLKIGWTQSLSDLDQYSPEEKRIVLEKALLAFGGDQLPRKTERQSNFEKAQSALLAIPGHAKYYQDQIEQTRIFSKHYESLSEDEKEVIRKDYSERQEDLWRHRDYDGVRKKAFEILGLLPSPEAVAVLGHFLEDPEGRDGIDLFGNPIFHGSDVGPPLPNCGQAYTALEKLGIEHPPITPSPLENLEVHLDRVDAWKQWWSEVKSGKRTYRFIGSPIEYGPDGPATKEQMERATKHQRREDRTTGGHGSSPVASEESGSSVKKTNQSIYVLLAAVAALLGSFAWYSRKTRSGMS